MRYQLNRHFNNAIGSKNSNIQYYVVISTKISLIFYVKSAEKLT